MEKKDERIRVATLGRIMTAMGLFGALAVIALRVWFSPAMRDVETGRFTGSASVMIVTLLLLGGLVAIVFVARGGPRQEIEGKPSLILSVLVLAVGAAMALTGVADIWQALRSDDAAMLAEANRLTYILGWLQHIFCALGGAALVRLGLLLASENATRRGMAQWSLLAPVLWMWVVLANYVMSADSLVRPQDGFFTLMTYVMELLFLFYFARYMAGVGKVGSITLLMFSAGTVVFSISTPLVKLIMYMLWQDGEAYIAAGATGVLDLAVGLLALVVCITLCQSLSVPIEQPKEEEEVVDWLAGRSSDSDLIEEVEKNEEA